MADHYYYTTIILLLQEQLKLSEPEPAAVSGLSPAAYKLWKEGYSVVEQGLRLDEDAVNDVPARINSTRVVWRSHEEAVLCGLTMCT